METGRVTGFVEVSGLHWQSWKCRNARKHVKGSCKTGSSDRENEEVL